MLSNPFRVDVNRCLSYGLFADKKGDRAMTSSYRPIAIISVLSKIIEKIAYDQLIKSMTVIVCSQMHSTDLREDDRLRLQLSDLWGEPQMLLGKKDL